MSGQQIGTAVGFVAGFFLPGGPQVWAAIGGFIGGVIDPTEIKGPHIGDGPQQSANEGMAIAWILGTAGWVQGGVVQASEKRVIEVDDSGKGGPEVSHEEFRQDYCIMPAESSETRGSTIVGVLMVRVNGIIVYDVRPDANMSSENSKFLQHHKFYYGAEDQMPDPTMEAISGVGNTPAYRGVMTMVARDVNLTPYGGAIPTYEFVLVGEGEVVTETHESLATQRYGRFANAHFPLLDPDSHYILSGHRNITSSGGVTEVEGDTIAEIVEAFNLLGFNGEPSNLTAYLGYSATTSTSPGTFKFDGVADQLDVSQNTSVLLVYSEHEPVEYLNTSPVADGCSLLPYVSPGQPDWYCFDQGELARITKGTPPSDPAFIYYNNCTNLPDEGGFFPHLQGIQPLYIRVISKRVPPSVPPIGDPCLVGVPVQLPDDPSHMIDCDGVISPTVSYEEISGTFHILQEEDTSSVDGRLIFEKYAIGPVLAVGDTDDTEAFWESAYDATVAAGTMPPGLIYGDDYPELTSTSYLGTSETSSIITNELSVATAIERICIRGGLEAEDMDTADIDATLQGYPIQADYNAADDLKPLLAYCSAFASEYDGKIHFHPYGGAIEIVIDPEDFIEGSDVTDEGSREQAKEYPRKLSVNYVDITQNYTVRPQYAYRTTPDVRAIGEETIQVPLCDTPDHAAKIAEIAMKVSYARLQGTRKFSVPYVGAAAYLMAFPGVPFALEGKRWVANKITLEDGLVAFEAAYDRQSAYNSVATGVPALPPTPPVSTIGGVTLFAGMNLPRLRSMDNSPGMYIAVAGLLSSWPGCVLQMSIDGGASWVTAIGSMTQESVLGYLTAPLDDTPSDTLSVAVHGGQLNSITTAQFADGGNPITLITDDVAEVMQFMDADETTTDHYDLTTLARAGLGTTAVEHNIGDRFVHLGNVYFLPLDISRAGRTIKFRPVTFGTVPESNATYDVVFSPLFTGPEVSRPITVGGENVTVGGSPIYVVT